MKAKTALDVKLGKAPKSALQDREVERLYRNYIVRDLQAMMKPKPGRPTKKKKHG